MVETALRWLQAQVLLDNAPPLWLCTTSTQLVWNSSVHRNAGLWGLARACRQERATQPAWCLDVSDDDRGATKVIRQETLRLPSGSVRGLRLSPSVEPEAAFRTAALHVPRLVAPYNVQMIIIDVVFTAVCCRLDAHIFDAMAALHMESLYSAYTLG